MSSSGGDAGKVIAPSRRPDGTLRKEIRVRAGYVPPDEVARYESKGTQFKKGVGVPGLDFVDGAGAKPKGKSASRNERRKQKKEEAASSAAATEGLEAQVASLSVDGRSKSNGLKETAKSSGPAHESAAPGKEAAEDERGALEKKLRALKKKLRQAEALEEGSKAGDALTEEQREKISKLPLWHKEEAALEQQISEART